MSINPKKEILARLAALKNTALALRPSAENLYASINNRNNGFDFLIDVIQILLGTNKIRDIVLDFLTNELPEYEKKIKDILKAVLIRRLSCNLDFIIPDEFVESFGVGFYISVHQIDFFSLFKVDPNTVEGELLYFDVNNDLNRVIYNAIQGTTSFWKDLLIIRYLPQAVVDGQMKNRVLQISINPLWQGKYIRDFVGRLLDSIQFLDLARFLVQLNNYVFGVLNVLIQKNSKTIENEQILENIVQRIIELDDLEIDDSFFDLSGQELMQANLNSLNLASASTNFNVCQPNQSTVNINNVVSLFDAVINANQNNYVEIRQIIDRGFKSIAEEASADLDPQSRRKGSLSIVLKYLRGILYGLAFNIISPKGVLVIITYGKLLGQIYNYKNFKEFLRDFRQIMIDLIKNGLLEDILQYLLKIVLQEISKSIEREITQKKAEYGRLYSLQQLSLLPIPDDIVQTIDRILRQ